MTYCKFVEKLAALIPTPRTHLVLWSGSFDPNCKYCKKTILNPEKKKGFHFEDDDGAEPSNNYK